MQNHTTAAFSLEAIFGGNWSAWAMVIIPPAAHTIIISGGIWNTGENPFIEIGVDSSAILQNVTVNSVHYHYVILKGSNETAIWTTDVAEEDAEMVFDGDLGFALSKSEEIRMRYAEPELTSLLEYVVEKLRNPEAEYSCLERKEDIAFIERLAKSKYGITESSDFIEEIMDFLEDKTRPPQKAIFGVPVEDPHNWIYVTVCCVFPILTFGLYSGALYLDHRFPLKSAFLKGWGKVLFGASAGLALRSLILDRPYDFHLFSVQTLVVVGALLVSMVGLLRIRHHLPEYMSRETRTRKTKRKTRALKV